MHSVLLLLGGNLGKVQENFARAVVNLSSHGEVMAISRLYRTEAWHMNKAPEFLNQAIILNTEMEPLQLLGITRNIEDEAGRNKDELSDEYQSRTLDIDILLVDEEIIDTLQLKVPHPRMHLRKFTMIPAAEIAGNWLHPVLNKDLNSLRDECTDSLLVLSL